MNKSITKSIETELPEPKRERIPSRPFTEEQLMQKPRPSFVTVIRGSKVNHFNLENYEKESKPQSSNR